MLHHTQHGIKHLSWLCFVTLLMLSCIDALTEKRRLELKELTKEMFEHGWSHYMQYAYPEDELNPFQCSGRGSDKADPHNINVNDVLGDYSLTLVDTLDTLAIIGTQKQFEEAVRLVIETVSFSQDNKVQVFELNIRALGGLLSAHLLATDPSFNYTIPGYQGELLEMAINLADRLIPAFESTKTGIPYPRVNLIHGVPPTETTETCTAGAGSLLLEFGVLSRLTGNSMYEKVAKRALDAIWHRRSEIGLLGNVIDIQTGRWIHTASSTGAGIDSIFEYMLKSYVLFGEQEYKDMFDEAYRALMLHVRDASGYLYRNVHMSSGTLMSYWIDSLSAFFPGLQVLYGDLDAAIKGHLIYFNIWRRYQALPERFDFFQKTVDLPYYPLRPEFIESTYHLYMATKDPFYLQVGEMVLEDLNNRTRVPCGFATLGDVRSGRQEDRMESFMLSETLKYLYLLFDSDHVINKMDSNYVFTTEGHILPLPAQYLKKREKKDGMPAQAKAVVSFQHSAAGTCERYNPMRQHYLSTPGHLDMSSLLHQPISDYAADIVGITNPVQPLTSTGYCDVPQRHGPFSLSFSYQRYQQKQANYPVLTQHTLVDLLGGYLAKSLSGFKLDIIGDSQGYFVKRVSPHNISLNSTQKLIVPMHSFLNYASQDLFEIWIRQPRLTTHLRNYFQSDDEVSIKATNHQICVEFLGVKSALGPHAPISLIGQTHVFHDKDVYGCDPYDTHQAYQIRDKILLISRGHCSFYQKILYAQHAGARAVILMNNQPDQAPFRATGSDNNNENLMIPSLMLSYEDSLQLVKHNWQQFSVQQLPSVDSDPNASFLVRFHGQWLHNLEILNV